jgi:hypothetical protein
MKTTPKRASFGSEVPIHQLTDKGIEAFQEYLKLLKAGSNEPMPSQLIGSASYARVIDSDVTVEPQHFETTMDMTRYLHPRIERLSLPDKLYDPGLWAWLTAFYFDAVCPPDLHGYRKVGEFVRYIPTQKTNRHLISIAVRLFAQHGEARMRLLLYTKPSQKSDYLRLIADNDDIASNAGLLDALRLLYWDEANQRPKRASKDVAGGILRFITVMNQFNRTYDLHAMTGKQIVQLLPKAEFGRWLASDKPAG